MQYARKLRRGDKVAIVSLSSGMLGEEFCSHNRSGQSGSYHVEPDGGQGISEWCAGETDSGSEAE
ncbi:hypothetical protein [Agathobacter rectalis]|jgi:hypothetical protein|uniref:Uncharacterized protein n=1 Tax=Agathobacter rectalis TaxID=39491 RepID=A0A413U0S6_9FIRM|nr:hypothetical protein [Agathobacter rectalis]RHA90811.1 hypothetical protein DW912_11080 [Agathobacter rectalis]RHB03484.1 hypothetical protein DW902_13080 [Agathobacter rectalis]